MNKSNAGFAGNSSGSTGGATKEDLERGYSLPKDDNDEAYGAFQRMFSHFGDYNPEPDRSIDRDTEKDWPPSKDINL